MQNDGKVAFIKGSLANHLHIKGLRPGLSKNKRLPDSMMGMTLETTRSFLSFILFCEGGVSTSGQFEFSSKSVIFVRQVKLLLLRFGIVSNLCEKHVPDYGLYYRLYINGRREQAILLDQLTGEWSEGKLESLKSVVLNKAAASCRCFNV